MGTSAPAASTITLHQCHHILSLYSQCISSFYDQKVKVDKRRSSALDTDNWRYHELPQAVRENEQPVTLSVLQRLVDWKITHGTFRPFLPAQIRKNDSQVVEEVASAAFEILSATTEESSVSVDVVKKALAEICRLHGVGPATGTLLLSVYDRVHIPFFEDELFHWLDPGFQGKLKYTVKEYSEGILERVQELMQRLRSEEGESIDAWQIEQIAFVCEHWDLVEREAGGVDVAGGEQEVKEKIKTGDDVKNLTGEKREADDADVGAKPDTKQAKLNDHMSQTAKVARKDKAEIRTSGSRPATDVEPRRSSRNKK